MREAEGEVISRDVITDVYTIVITKIDTNDGTYFWQIFVVGVVGD